MLAISRRSLFSPSDLILDGGIISWGTASPDYWIIGDFFAQRSLESLCEVAGLPPLSAIPHEFVRSMDGISRGQVPWPLIIPQRVLGDHLRNLESVLEESIERLGDYTETLASSRRVLSMLRPARIDLAALRVEQGRSSSSVLDSFEPGSDSLCQVPVYSHGTATGRLTVREGPRILTLQKEHRRILSSRFEGGRMMQVDFISLEPRVLRLLEEGFAPVDIYSDVSERLGGAASRRQVKLATLKLLYGSSRAGITEEIGSVGGKALRSIEEYFGLPSLRARLASELGKSGIIKSMWGRPLPEATETHLLVSHFTQSTAVDVAMGGFSDMMERIRGEDLDIIPCYVLHDALLLDVHPDAETRLTEIVGEGLDVEGLGHFEVSLTPAYLEEES